MRYFLENEVLRLEVESKGAEIRSLIKKENGQEYMWSGDEAYWSGVSPLLFPFIGSLKNGRYFYKGREYAMAKHGFASKMEFTVLEQEKGYLVMGIRDTEETRKCYPFSFRLEVAYRLDGSAVTESWRVYNDGRETMYFSIGGHPAFACPPAADPEGDGKTRSRTECSILLTGTGEREQVDSLCVIPGGLLSGQTVKVDVREGSIPISPGLFSIDTILLREQINAASLCDGKGREYVRVESAAPVWGIWSLEDCAASYICLEPWFGLCDYDNFQGELEDRPFTNRVKPGNVWEQGFRVIVG